MSNKYFEIDDEGKKLFITQTALKTGLPAVVVEKDLWVCHFVKLRYSATVLQFEKRELKNEEIMLYLYIL